MKISNSNSVFKLDFNENIVTKFISNFDFNENEIKDYCSFLDKYKIPYAKLLNCQVVDNILQVKQQLISGKSMSSYLYQHIAQGYKIDKNIKKLFNRFLKLYFDKIVKAHEIRVDCKLDNFIIKGNKLVLVDITPPLFINSRHSDKSFHYSNDVQIKNFLCYFLKPFILLGEESTLKEDIKYFVRELEIYLINHSIKSEQENDKFELRYKTILKFVNNQIDVGQFKEEFIKLKYNYLLDHPIVYYKKIHIVGGPCTGKTFLLNKLVNQSKFSTLSLDNIFWKSNSFKEKEDKKVRDEYLVNFINDNQNYIVEGSYYQDWLKSSFERADIIFVLKIDYKVMKKRIWRRFWRRKFHLENSSKKETFCSVRNLVKWSKDYNNKLKDNIDSGLLAEYSDKIVFLYNNIDIIQQLAYSL
jgi:adenylate kinase family enzyme